MSTGMRSLLLWINRLGTAKMTSVMRVAIEWAKHFLYERVPRSFIITVLFLKKFCLKIKFSERWENTVLRYFWKTYYNVRKNFGNILQRIWLMLLKQKRHIEHCDIILILV